MNLKIVAGLLASGLFAAAPAFSDTIDFEGVANGFGSIADYYNAGSDIPVSGPASSGPNFGVHFGLDLLAVSDPDHANTANLPSGTSAMAVGGTGGDYSMTRGGGFTSLSMYYSAISDTSVTLSFVGGATQTYNLLANSGSCDAAGPAFCLFSLATLDLAGRNATAVNFGATAGIAAFDNIQVNPVPLPAAIGLLPMGLAFLGGMVRRRRQNV